jgi:hypothetical protein
MISKLRQFFDSELGENLTGLLVAIVLIVMSFS